MTHRRRSLRLVVLAPLAAILAACSSGTTTTTTDGGQAPPVAGTYTIDFPSLSAAVYTQEVQVFVYADVADAGSCQTLVQDRKSGASLPATLAGTSSQPVSICSLNTGTGILSSIPFGTYQILVVGLSGGQAVLIGCQQQTISASQPNMTIPVTLASSQVVIPGTTCSDLSDHCANKCN